MKTPFFSLCGLFLLICLISGPGMFGQETRIMVRALAKDAKFIGSSIGGARIIIRDLETGAVLTQGITAGETGDTGRIVLSPSDRYEQITDNNTAGFLAELSIDQPTFIEVEARGPKNKKQAAVISSTQLWVFPGKHILGDGIILELPGLVVEILSPQTHETLAEGSAVDITANLVMLCGCPVTEEGIWDANQMEIKAYISSSGEGMGKEMDLTPTGKPSTFSGAVSLETGNYEITVFAFDPRTGNSGLDKVNFLVR